MSGTDKQIKCTVCGDPVAVVTQPEQGYIHAWDGRAGLPERPYEHAVRLDVEPTLDQLYDRIEEIHQRQHAAIQAGDYAADARALREEEAIWRQALDALDVTVHPLLWLAVSGNVSSTQVKAVRVESCARQAGGAS